MAGNESRKEVWNANSRLHNREGFANKAPGPLALSPLTWLGVSFYTTLLNSGTGVNGAASPTCWLLLLTSRIYLPDSLSPCSRGLSQGLFLIYYNNLKYRLLFLLHLNLDFNIRDREREEKYFISFKISVYI